MAKYSKLPKKKENEKVRPTLQDFLTPHPFKKKKKKENIPCTMFFF